MKLFAIIIPSSIRSHVFSLNMIISRHKFSSKLFFLILFIINAIIRFPKNLIVTVALLTLLVFSSQGYCLVKVEVKGVEGPLKRNVLALLEIYRERKEKDVSPARVRLLYQQGFSQVKKALEPFGYFSPLVKGTISSPKKGIWHVVYQISKGEPVRIKEVDIKILGPGKDDQRLKIKPPFRPGDVFKQEKYEKYKEELLQTARTNGYLRSFFKCHKVIVNPETHSAAICLHLDTGVRFRFGRLDFRDTTLSKDFLEDYADFKYGEPLDVSKLGKFRSRLLDSDYFRDVQIDYSTDEAGANETIPIVVTCPMKKPNVYRLGLGYVSDVGPRVTLEWKRRYIGKKGHHIRSKFQISSEETLISGEYFIPLSRPYSDYLSIKPFIEHYDTDARKGWKYNVSLMYSVATSGGWRRNAGINFGYENYKAGGEKDDSKELVPFISWYKSKADNVLYANRGYSVKFALSGEIGGFFANQSYLSSLFNTKVIRRFAGDYRVIARMDAGVIASKDIDGIPSSARFYAGGQNSIRGFSLEELGPKNPKTGRVTGGRYLGVGSLELERHIYKMVSGAVFVDAGNSFDPEYKNRVEVGTGFGLRLRTPLGPVRLDFGFGVSKNPVPFKFYLSVGPDF